MQFSASDLNPADLYPLLVGAIVPRPIAWISTISAQGISNIAPYSFFTVASCNPPVLLVTQVNPPHGRDKDTLRNLRETQNCVVNIVSADSLEAMNSSCADYPPEVSEFAAVGIATTPSFKVTAPSAKNSRVRYECTLREIISLSHQPMGGQMMLLDVVSIYVEDQLLHNGMIKTIQVDAMGKMGGNFYSFTREVVELARPILS